MTADQIVTEQDFINFVLQSNITTEVVRVKKNQQKPKKYSTFDKRLYATLKQKGLV